MDGLPNILCQLLLGSSLEVAASLLFQDYITSRGVKLGEVERQRYDDAFDEGSNLVGCETVWMANGCPRVSHEDEWG